MTVHTFLSYARADETVAEAVRRGLEGKGLATFKDTRMRPGEDWVTRIRRHLADVPSVVVLWSKASVDSLWVRTEAGEAAHRGVLVPVRIQSVRPPPLFDRYQTLDLIGWDGSLSARAFRRLCDAVRAYVDGRRGALPHAAWFTVLGPEDPVSDLDLALEHTTWRDPSKDRGGHEMYQVRLILVGNPTTLERVERVTYFLDDWEDGPDYTSTRRNRNFELRQLAYGDFVARATVVLKGEQPDLILSRFVRLAESGPYLDRYMLDPRSDAAGGDSGGEGAS